MDLQKVDREEHDVVEKSYNGRTNEAEILAMFKFLLLADVQKEGKFNVSELWDRRQGISTFHEVQKTLKLN